METIIQKVRYLIEDILLSTGYDIEDYKGISKVFTLSEPHISAATIKVYKNGSLWDASNYSFNPDNNKLTITGSLVAGNIIEVTYSYYKKYGDRGIKGYICSALAYLSTERYKDFKDECGILFPTPDELDENLIARVASILINKSIRSFKTPEITITFGEEESVDSKIRKLINIHRSKTGILNYHSLKDDK